jgi:hypothetical protein
MVKLQDASNLTLPSRNQSHHRLPNPFYVIYNHRRIVRARALKKIKQEKRKVERKLQLEQMEALKEQNVKDWNFSMLDDDFVWENACEKIKKEEK